MSRWLLGGLFCLATGCRASFPAAQPPTTSFHLRGGPGDAAVVIDEERVGPLALVAARGVALPKGTHQVTVEAPGYFPWDRLVVADPERNRRIDLNVELVPIPP